MLKNMKIGVRLMAAFLVAIILSSVAGIIGVFLLKKSDADYSTVLDNYGFAQGELGNLGRKFQASRVLNLYVVTAQDEATRNDYLKQLADEDANVDRYMLEVKGRLGSPQGQKVYAELETGMAAFRVAREKAFAETAVSKDAGANVVTYRAIMLDSSQVVSKVLDTMIVDKTSIGFERSAGLTSQTILFTWIMIGILVAAVVLAFILALMIAKGISRPIAQIEKAAAQMSKGNYDAVVEYRSRDEVGLLAQSMRQMMATTKGIIMDTSRGLGEIANGNFDIAPEVECFGVFKQIEGAMEGIIADLSATMSQIKTAANQVSSGSEQVSSGAQALAQGATEQASAVQQLSASISEISEQIGRNANNSRTASELVAKVGDNIHTSNDQMVHMMDAMSEISSSSSQISKIIKTIEDIAFQTNILALNAAVEAARAGAAGKGFAVVADEVRNLATKSSEAAKQTNVLIEGSVKSVENGVKIADGTAKSLAEVVAGAREVTDLITKISQASAEQSTSITQINQGVEQISSVVQTNSATSEESAAASEQLSGQANMMKEAVAKFRLRNDRAPAQAQAAFAPPAHHSAALPPHSFGSSGELY